MGLESRVSLMITAQRLWDSSGGGLAADKGGVLDNGGQPVGTKDFLLTAFL